MDTSDDDNDHGTLLDELELIANVADMTSISDTWLNYRIPSDFNTIKYNTITYKGKDDYIDNQFTSIEEYSATYEALYMISILRQYKTKEKYDDIYIENILNNENQQKTTFKNRMEANKKNMYYSHTKVKSMLRRKSSRNRSLSPQASYDDEDLRQRIDKYVNMMNLQMNI